MKFIKVTCGNKKTAIVCDKITGLMEHKAGEAGLETDIFVDHDPGPYRVKESMETLIGLLEVID